jgi:mannose-6-phosphate isomerase-like protein (cupin superfamily)
MRKATAICVSAIAMSNLAVAHADSARDHASTPQMQATHESAQASSRATGLILQAEEGERMRRRWGLPMTIKIDPVNGGSQRLLVGTEDLPPGKSIPVHKHSHCDEVVLVLQGNGIAMLGDQRRSVGAGATVFIPEDEWFGMENTGSETIRVVFIFSDLGFDKYLRATSVPEGQPVVAFTPSELAEVRNRFKGVITFKDQ